MSMDDRSPLSGTDSGCASEVQPSDQGPTLDDLSPAQAQRLLEAALRRYRPHDEVGSSGDGALPTQQQSGTWGDIIR